MDKKILLSIVVISVLALAAAMLLPGGRPPDRDPALPWKIGVGRHGLTQVLGLELGTSSLADAQERFAETGLTNLFRSPEGDLSIEVFFDKIYLSGLKADIVLTLEVPEEVALEMLKRGIRSAGLGDGSKKVTLAPRDIERLSTAPVAAITYIPATDLEPALLEQLFGRPSRRIREDSSATAHWLYPDRGLDVVVNLDGREVFQYVDPRKMERLTDPLRTLDKGLGRHLR